MLKSKKSSIIRNQKGMAIFEMIPIMIVIVLLLNFSIGFFGAIHTGILNSIAARNYAFSTFGHRANLTYLRNTRTAQYQYSQHHLRYHGVTAEGSADTNAWVATKRKVDFFDFNKRPEVTNGAAVHNNQVRKVCDFGDKNCKTPRNESVSANPIWIKTSYGICLDAICGS